jgi:XTP/dITP diphosphohydrolase
MKIIIASGNPGKLKEIRAILNSCTNLPLDISSIQGMAIPEPDEPYPTFMENACHKAKYYADFTKGPTLSEDAGLCIEALDGFPGLKTKDFYIESGGLEQAYKKLQAMLANTNNYKAYFICAAALYLPKQDKFVTYEGLAHGAMAFPPQGELGFGYDPIFIPEGFDKTMAELGEEHKNQSGHRAKAIMGIADKLRTLAF